MSTDEKLENLENMTESVRGDKGENTKFFQCVEKYRNSGGPLTKAIGTKKLDIFSRWMEDQLCREKGGYILYMWVTYGVELVGLGTSDRILGFKEAILVVARSLQNPVGRAFMLEKWKNYCIFRMTFWDYLTQMD